MPGSASSVAASGMQGFRNSLAAHSENVANASTDCFKKKIPVMLFAGGGYLRNRTFSPTGSMCQVIQNIAEQGILRPTENGLDMAVIGNGMFVYSGSSVLDPSAASADPQSFLYARGGRHSPDKLGYLQHIDGKYVMGWPVDDQGNVLPTINTSTVDSLEPIRVSKIGGFAKSTSNIDLQVNIPAVDPGGNTYETKVDAYDSLGRKYQVAFNWTRTAVGHLELTVTCPDAVSVHQNDLAGADFTTTPLTILMDGNGKPLTFDGGTVPPKLFLEINGSNNLTIDLGLGSIGGDDGLTSIGNQYAAPVIYQDGKPYGNFSDVSIGSDGLVSAFFDNGLSVPIYQIAMVNFQAINRLEPKGSFYIPTSESGNYVLSTPGKAGFGSIQASAVESSTTDIASEFIGVISDQQAFSANSKIVKTDKDMMDDLLALIR